MKQRSIWLWLIFGLCLMGTRPIWSSTDFFKNKTKIKDLQNLRDPFKIAIGRKSSQHIEGEAAFKDGVFTNVPSVEGEPLEDLKIMGVLLGKERRALALGKNGLPVLLREGMVLGPNKAEIKAIMPGGIVLVEKIVNVYGQDEYLETVLPITGEPQETDAISFQQNSGSSGQVSSPVAPAESAPVVPFNSGPAAQDPASSAAEESENVLPPQ